MIILSITYIHIYKIILRVRHIDSANDWFVMFKSEHAFDKILDKIRIEKTLSCEVVYYILWIYKDIKYYTLCI